MSPHQIFLLDPKAIKQQKLSYLCYYVATKHLDQGLGFLFDTLMQETSHQ